MNTLRSAISAIANIDDKPTGKHPLISRFLKAVFQEKPPLSRSLTTWDPELMFTYIKSLGATESLSNIQLSKNLAVLMSYVYST